MPKVDIVVPTYNGARYIVPALQSVLGQTFKDYELTVVDDRSTDQTPQIVTSMRDSRVRLVINEQRQGLVRNWNRCIEQAQADYTCIFHQDDLLLSPGMERLVAALDDHPKVGFAFSNMTSIDEHGDVIGGHWSDCLPGEDAIFSEQEFFHLLLSQGNLVPCSSVVVRSSCYQQLGVFDHRLKYTPDLEMWLRLSMHYDVAYIAEPLVSFRRHSGQESNHYMGKLEEIREVWRALRIIFTEQSQHIADPERAFALAMAHIERWTAMFATNAAKRARFVEAAQFGQQFLIFRNAHRKGIGSLTPVC